MYIHADTKGDQCDIVIKKGIEAFRQKKYAKSLEILTKARDFAEKNHLDRQLFLALINIGNNYQYMYDYGEALDYFLESYAIAIKLEPRAEIMAVHNIANLYVMEEDYDKAIEYFGKAHEAAKVHKGEGLFLGLTLSGLAYCVMEKGDLTLSRQYMLEALENLKDSPEEAQTAKILLLENTLRMGNPAEARAGATKLYNTSPYLDYDDGGVQLQLVIAKSYSEEKNYALATDAALRILAANPDLDIKKKCYNLLSQIYADSNNLKGTLQYKDSLYAIQNRLNDIKNGRLFEVNKVKFEIKQYKSQIAANEEKLRFERMIFYFALAVALAIIVIGFLIFKQKRMNAARNRDLILLDLEKEKTNNLLLEQQITGGLLEQERLKNEVEARNRKLSAKALHLSGRNELIEEILEYLSKRPKFSKDTMLANYVQSLREHLKTDNEWDDFIAHFEEVNSGFLNRLKAAHPTLTVSDIRFIAYMYMNLSTKEIAFILNITTLASKKRKERLAAKMEIAKEQDLYDYIATL
jgi:hypothetical protein